ncbi:MAG TPA: translation initiation factor IF-3 [bacterium]|nr:translation initiation factor IF-3 [bacterium]HQA64245.1 translation initiation factor IF-3 [bacterium]
MRRSFRGRKKTTAAVNAKMLRANEKIFARRLMLIDENGNNLGEMSKEEALRRATEADLDLVEVSPKANPPICRLMNYGSYKYQQEKKEKKQKAQNKGGEVKTVKMSFRISQHDKEIRAKRVLKFLGENNKVRIEMQLRGRENQHTDLAKENIKNMIDEINNQLINKEIKIEQEIKKQGNKLSAVITL